MTDNRPDWTKLIICSGHGGAGAVHFRRARFIPKGGPDGGHGGRGGNIILKGNIQLSNLLHLKYLKHIIAPDGNPGAAKSATGADGKDKIIPVPLGTIIREENTGEIKKKITHHNQEIILAYGGRGGKGNIYFKQATRRTPNFAQSGEPGQKLSIILQLNMIADIGLIGLPNAGKSALLSALSAAKPKIANYPFTTTTPQLGTMIENAQKNFVIVDTPGIIKGASQGKGLGLRFLQHAEHTKILVFVITADQIDITQVYHTLCQELHTYNPSLLTKKHFLAISKVDLQQAPPTEKQLKKLPQHLEHLLISAKTKQGIDKLKIKLITLLNR